MARHAAYSNTLLAQVRRYYGLQQQEMAALLGVSPAQANYLEAGSRTLTREVSERLAPFRAQMVPDQDPLLITPPPGPFDLAPLEQRHAACLHQAARLRHSVRELPMQARYASRWARAMPALRAALAPALASPENATTCDTVRQRFAYAWLGLSRLALPPTTLAQWHLAHQRALALEAEAAALAILIESTPVASATD